MFLQRSPAPRSPTAGPWRPPEVVRTAASDRGAPGAPRIYVVVDELDERQCRLTVDPWPDVDADGRLVFSGRDTQLVPVPATDLHAEISRSRAELGQEAPDRALRIGDVFGVLVVDGDAASLAGWRPPEPGTAPARWVVDVTRSARQAAHAAVEAAASGVLAPADAARLGLVDTVQRGATRDGDEDQDPGP